MTNPIEEIPSHQQKFKCRVFSFYVNPLYLVFGEAVDERDNNEPKPLTTDELPVLSWRFKSTNAEDLRMSSSKHKKLKAIIGKNFGLFQNTFGDDLPILLITYVFSIFLAIQPKLRMYFYINYDGLIPVFTQFLLESLRIGMTVDDQFLLGISFDPCYNYYMHGKHSDDASSILYLDGKAVDDMGPLLLLWFKLLDHYLKNNDLYFKHFIKLRKTPFVSKNPLTLTSFDQGNISNSSIAANSKNKERYLILNKALNAKIETYNVPGSKLLDVLRVIEEAGDIDKNNELANQLMDLIADCPISALEQP